jgi:hypothetical protein
MPSALGPVLMFCALGLVFWDSEGDKSRFQVLRVRISFWQYRGRRVLFACFVHLDTFPTVRRASRPVFDGTEVIGSRFHVLRSRTHIRRYRVRRVPFSCFALLDTFSAVGRASSSVFMFCASELIFGDTEGVESRFHVLRSQTRFRQCRVRRVPF